MIHAPDLQRLDDNGLPCIVQKMQFLPSILTVEAIYFDATTTRVPLEHLVNTQSYDLFTRALTEAQWRDAETMLTAYWLRSVNTWEDRPRQVTGRRYLRTVG